MQNIFTKQKGKNKNLFAKVKAKKNLLVIVCLNYCKNKSIVLNY